MKIRNGFVSNSSSSSFIVIGFKGHKYVPAHEGPVLEIPTPLGETEFGWGPETIGDAYSLINFAYFQAYYAKRSDWLEMLTEVLLENFEEVKEIKYSEEFDDWKSKAYGYIDHQSSALEGENTEMFNSKEDLERFLFNSASEIVLDNDNH